MKLGPFLARWRGQPLRYGHRLCDVNAGVARLLALVVLVAAGGPAYSASERHVLVLGDSLAAGYGLPAAQAFTARLEASLRQARISAVVHNAGVSGDTSAGGRARLDWALAGVPGGRPDLVIVELGANDALRGLAPQTTEANLAAILEALARQRVPALLAGMKAPRNMGRDYVAAFDAIYPRLAAQFNVPLYPFFLDGVVAEPRLNQPDGIHPNAEGVGVIVAAITPLIAKTLGPEAAPR
ncbi:MAG: arylesterase [Alphaproteobacteria bacterium]